MNQLPIQASIILSTPPRYLTFLLYIYAVIQLAYAGFENTEGSLTLDWLQWFAAVSSLPLKLLLIAFWYWIYQNGLLAFYMRNTRIDLDTVQQQWKKFETFHQ